MKGGAEEPNKKPEPTKAELEVLHIIWQHGPSTVRFVNDRLNETREVNYTSTLKVMQIMADKGILRRDESQMKHVYHANEAEQQTKDMMVERFVESVYQGAGSKLVMQVLGNKKTSKEDLASIREILDRLEKQ